MVKRFVILKVPEEVRNLAKSNASLQGMKLGEYIERRVKADAPSVRESLDRLTKEQEDGRKHRGGRIGFFK